MERSSDVTIGFYNHANNKLQATEASLLSVRLIYPDAPYAITCDNGYDFSELCQRHNVQYFHFYESCGYPIQPYGFRLPNVLRWLDRMYMGVSTLETDYFLTWEDDCILLDKLTIDPNWQAAGHNNLHSQEPGNDLPPTLLNMIADFSGHQPLTSKYNCGGGTMFNTKTFLDNYSSVRSWFVKNLTAIQDSVYPTLGWMDCFMTVYFMLCGKDISVNPELLNIWPTQIPYDINKTPQGIKILHNFKDYY